MRSSALLLSLLCFCLNSGVKSQDFELGLLGGFAVYSGDLSPDEFGLYFEDVHPAGGVYARLRPIDRFALRFNAMFTQLTATDEEALSGNTPSNRQRFLNFRTDLTEFALTAEFDLFYIGNRRKSYAAPYISVGGGLIFFDPEGQLEGSWRELQPLATEGQGIPDSPNYASKPYSLSEFVPAFGGGLRWQVNEKVSLGIEIGGRRVASDYLDDVSSTRVSYLDVLGNTGGLAAEYSNPNIIDPQDESVNTYVRGGEHPDWYFQGGLTLGVTLGKGNGRGTGCYTF